MRIGPQKPCTYCEQEVLICRLRTGDWVPFDLAMVPAADDAPDTYLPAAMPGLPGSAPHDIVMVPVADIAPARLQGTRWYAQRHRCGPYFRALAARRAERAEKRLQAVDDMRLSSEDIQGWFTGGVESP